MRRVVLWDTACNFNAVISNQSIFNCLITGASILIFYSEMRHSLCPCSNCHLRKDLHPSILLITSLFLCVYLFFYVFLSLFCFTSLQGCLCFVLTFYTLSSVLTLVSAL